MADDFGEFQFGKLDPMMLFRQRQMTYGLQRGGPRSGFGRAPLPRPNRPTSSEERADQALRAANASAVGQSQTTGVDRAGVGSVGTGTPEPDTSTQNSNTAAQKIAATMLDADNPGATGVRAVATPDVQDTQGGSAHTDQFNRPEPGMNGGAARSPSYNPKALFDPEGLPEQIQRRQEADKHRNWKPKLFALRGEKAEHLAMADQLDAAADRNAMRLRERDYAQHPENYSMGQKDEWSIHSGPNGVYRFNKTTGQALPVEGSEKREATTLFSEPGTGAAFFRQGTNVTPATVTERFQQETFGPRAVDQVGPMPSVEIQRERQLNLKKPEPPQRPVPVPRGGKVIDPVTGKTIAENPLPDKEADTTGLTRPQLAYYNSELKRLQLQADDQGMMPDGRHISEHSRDAFRDALRIGPDTAGAAAPSASRGGDDFKYDPKTGKMVDRAGNEVDMSVILKGKKVGGR